MRDKSGPISEADRAGPHPCLPHPCAGWVTVHMLLSRLRRHGGPHTIVQPVQGLHEALLSFKHTQEEKEGHIPEKAALHIEGKA